jgi:pimeloyl-ACP methyl ester carboxylesterase
MTHTATPAAYVGPCGAAALRELRAVSELRALRQHPVWDGDGLPRGDGLTVLLVPGFLAGDWSLATLHRWLERHRYRVSYSQLRFNVRCPLESLDRLEATAQRLAERAARPLVAIGHSLGGELTRMLAARRPDLVLALITLGSPTLDPLAVHPLVKAHIAYLQALRRLGIPGVLGRDCVSGNCHAEMRTLLHRPLSPAITYTSIYSLSDGLVDWRACLDPAAEHVEVRSSHLGMAANAEVYRAIARCLTHIQKTTPP